MKAGMEDLFYGSVRNYRRTHIFVDSNATKWINRIPSHFEELGIMLGARTEYEWKRYD